MSDFKFKEGDIALCVLPEEVFEAKVISRNYIMEDGEIPTYQVLSTKHNEVITISEDRMQYSPNYAVSYIASAPEELKIGDRVKIVGTNDEFEGETGVIKTISDSAAGVNLDLDKGYFGFSLCYLRKLPDASNPMDKQVGGSHYNMPIQPVEFIERNGLGFCVGNCIKYLCRYKKKNGKQDLEKAKHFIDLLIQLEYPE